MEKIKKSLHVIFVVIVVVAIMIPMTVNASAAAVLHTDGPSCAITPAIEKQVEDALSTYVSETQQNIADIAANEPATAGGWCAQWVMNCYAKAGYRICGNANELWAKYCDKDVKDIQPGMLIAVLHSGPYGDSYTYGHVGIYVGNGEVVHSIGRIDKCSLEEWVEYFDYSGTVKCGYPDDIDIQIEMERINYTNHLLCKLRTQAVVRTTRMVVKPLSLWRVK